MKRVVQYGYDQGGRFVIQVVEDDYRNQSCSDQTISLTRAECQKILKHMQFGKKGEQRVVESVDGAEIK
jgi:hypothetical protein